jgi:nucleoside phosphorylase
MNTQQSLEQNAPAKPPIEVFLSYAPEDEELLRQLEKHLSLLKRQGVIATWHDRQIVAGMDRAQIIDQQLEQAQMILLLVSADFVASDYCYGHELQRALERHWAGQAQVIPILLRPVDWQGTPFAHLQALPTNGKAVTSWTKRDEVLTEIASELRRMIAAFTGGEPAASAPVEHETTPSPHSANHIGRGEANAPLSPPQAIAGKYHIVNQQGVQGQVIGDHVTIHLAPDPALSPSALSPSPAKILVVTVTEIETRAVIDAFKELGLPPYHRLHLQGKTYYDFGLLQDAHVVLVQSEMGAVGIGAATTTIYKAITALSPTKIILVGIAFGVKKNTQKIGDILVSRQLFCYEPQKLGTNRDGTPLVLNRGDRATASASLLDKFRSGVYEWSDSAVHFGLMLTGEKLISDENFRTSLLHMEPEAIGGEMEGAGLYVVAQEEHVDWIVVKAICDWADRKKGQKNKDQLQRVAAKNAARFVAQVLQIGGLVDGSGRPASSEQHLPNP